MWTVFLLKVGDAAAWDGDTVVKKYFWVAGKEGLKRESVKD